jgi:predicted transposase YdaD
MAKIWDSLMKMLVRANPQDFVSFLTQETYYQGDVTNELIIRSVDADFLCQATKNAQDIIVHAEYQRRRDKNMARRLWEYNVATSFLTKLPVLSFAIYLWKEKNIATSPYKIEIDGELVHLFYYKNVFLWEETPERLLQPGFEGLLPLLPLLKGAKQTRDETIGNMVEGLRTAGKDDILALGYAFAGLVYRTEDDKEWLKRRFAMFHEILEDSWSYQEMVQKGIDVGLQKGLDQGLQQGLQKGLDQGIKQGELMSARSFLTRIIEKHFLPLLPLAQQKAAQLKTVDALNTTIDKLLEAQTIEQAREVLEESIQ